MRLFDTAAKRWAGVGPYYAMFPARFADGVIQEHTDRGDTILDPFAGRGTSIYSASVQGRHGIGIELNPVGWLYAKTKISVAAKVEVQERLEVIGDRATLYADEARALPPFFHRCFSRDVRRFLVAARAELNWRTSRVDRTTMALVLVNMHGKREASLSNQMRQTKAMSPDYSIAWWNKRHLDPPDVDPVEFMMKRLEWRYAKGVPSVTESHVYLGDSLNVLDRVHAMLPSHRRAQLLFTSPPYLGLTNYHYDQWLRLWALGGHPNALRVGGRNRGKFEHAVNYKTLLVTAFRKASTCMKRHAVVYVRTGRDQVTRKATREALTEVFPSKKLFERDRPFKRPTQTSLFGGTGSDGEVDLVMMPA